MKSVTVPDTCHWIHAAVGESVDTRDGQTDGEDSLPSGELVQLAEPHLTRHITSVDDNR